MQVCNYLADSDEDIIFDAQPRKNVKSVQTQSQTELSLCQTHSDSVSDKLSSWFLRHVF